jgi:hypothetical protein
LEGVLVAHLETGALRGRGAPVGCVFPHFAPMQPRLAGACSDPSNRFDSG